MPLNGQIYRYFTNDEAKNMDKEFMATLDRARDIAGVPFIITSGYRDAQHNFAVGGVSDSAHCHVDPQGNPAGLAVDLLVNSDQQASLILKGLFSVGFCRIGLYHDANENFTHIHVDSSMALPQNVVWLKSEGSNVPVG